ncbi:hypothetical protein [Aquimarina sp. I32.4]|uniref:hypothetical protein n=1 Tax=Aquimarina sp. I32.4 TaxID=2053903 RepID=UPI000CDEB5BC|nr:hypothetical protein [Aquimarina sp. I32.4]
MIKNLLNLENVVILKREEQKTLNGGGAGFGCQPQFLDCLTDRDCPCGPCGLHVGGFYVPDLCAF